MSDLENVLRRLARLLQPVEEADDAARVADDAEPQPDPGDQRPGEEARRTSARDLPHPGAAAS